MAAAGTHRTALQLGAGVAVMLLLLIVYNVQREQQRMTSAAGHLKLGGAGAAPACAQQDDARGRPLRPAFITAYDVSIYGQLGIAAAPIRFSPGKPELKVVTANAGHGHWWQASFPSTGVWIWERETQKAFTGCITSNTTVIDFGSWIGPTVLLAAALGAKRVISFEPDPKAYAELELNVRINALQSVLVHHGCVSPEGGSIPLFYRDGGSTSNTVNLTGATWEPTVIDASSGVIDVPCWRLEHVMSHYKVQGPTFIKVDVEGFEVELAPTLKRVALATQAPMHVSVHAALRKFTDADWAALVDFLAVYPQHYINNGTVWQRAELDGTVKRWAAEHHNTEVLVMWPGGCPCIEAGTC